MSLDAYLEIMAILYLFLDSSPDDHSPHHQGREQRPQSAVFCVPRNTSRQVVADVHDSFHCEYILYLQLFQILVILLGNSESCQNL